MNYLRTHRSQTIDRFLLSHTLKTTGTPRYVSRHGLTSRGCTSELVPMNLTESVRQVNRSLTQDDFRVVVTFPEHSTQTGASSSHPSSDLPNVSVPLSAMGLRFLMCRTLWQGTCQYATNCCPTQDSLHRNPIKQ